MKVVNLGVIGCGDISGIYLKNLTGLFKNTRVVALCDLDRAAAAGRAAEFGVETVCATAEELVALPEVEAVVILTPPATHARLMRLALETGKHAYCEKPLALDMDAADSIVALAQSESLLAGAAPDTVLGAGIQTCKKLVEDGWIGDVTGAHFTCAYFGPEYWHPNPAFIYQKGGGPMLDIGPYYIAALACLLGPVKRVSSFAKATWSERMATSPTCYGQILKVEVPTYVAGIMEFESGTLCSFTLTFDGVGTPERGIELIGTNGSLVVPDPDTFGGKSGTVRYKALAKDEQSRADNDWGPVPHLFGYAQNSRGVGVADLASAIIYDRKPRLSTEFSRHVLEVMLALTTPAPGASALIESRFAPMKILPKGLGAGEMD